MELKKLLRDTIKTYFEQAGVVFDKVQKIEEWDYSLFVDNNSRFPSETSKFAGNEFIPTYFELKKAIQYTYVQVQLFAKPKLKDGKFGRELIVLSINVELKNSGY